MNVAKRLLVTTPVEAMSYPNSYLCLEGYGNKIYLTVPMAKVSAPDWVLVLLLRLISGEARQSSTGEAPAIYYLQGQPGDCVENAMGWALLEEDLWIAEEFSERDMEIRKVLGLREFTLYVD